MPMPVDDEEFEGYRDYLLVLARAQVEADLAAGSTPRTSSRRRCATPSATSRDTGAAAAPR